MKRCALFDFPFRPYPAALALDDTLNRGQPNSSSREIAGRVQALKSPKQLAGVRLVEAGAVVPHEVLPAAVLAGTAEFNPGMRLFGGELPGVSEQIGQHDPQQARVGFSDETIGNHEFSVALWRGSAQFVSHFMSHLA